MWPWEDLRSGSCNITTLRKNTPDSLLIDGIYRCRTWRLCQTSSSLINGGNKYPLPVVSHLVVSLSDE